MKYFYLDHTPTNEISIHWNDQKSMFVLQVSKNRWPKETQVHLPSPLQNSPLQKTPPAPRRLSKYFEDIAQEMHPIGLDCDGKRYEFATQKELVSFVKELKNKGYLLNPSWKSILEEKIQKTETKIKNSWATEKEALQSKRPSKTNPKIKSSASSNTTTPKSKKNQ